MPTLRNAYPSFPNSPASIGVNPLLNPVPTMKVIISVSYSLIHSLNLITLHTIRTPWEDDLH